MVTISSTRGRSNSAVGLGEIQGQHEASLFKAEVFLNAVNCICQLLTYMKYWLQNEGVLLVILGWSHFGEMVSFPSELALTDCCC